MNVLYLAESSCARLLHAAQGICAQAAARWDLTKVALAHKTGTCIVGEPSVIIAASSPHRRDALEVRASSVVGNITIICQVC